MLEIQYTTSYAWLYVVKISICQIDISTCQFDDRRLSFSICQCEYLCHVQVHAYWLCMLYNASYTVCRFLLDVV